jgi:non-ribosomal peptide synthetase component F
VQRGRGGLQRVRLPAGVPERLRQLGQEEGASLFMVLLAVYQALLSRSGAGADVEAGTPVAGRMRGETEG